MNNILQHFATAYFGLHLKGDAGMQTFFNVVPQGKDAVYSMDRDGKPTADAHLLEGLQARHSGGPGARARVSGALIRAPGSLQRRPGYLAAKQ